MVTDREAWPRWVGIAGAVWGTVGVLGMLASAVYRLTPPALAAYETPLSGWMWGLVAAVCVFMAYSEGYRGFQKRFSPRTAARIRYLRDHPDPVNSALAPVFAFGFFRADRRTQLTAFGLTTGIVILVIVVHRVEQPWRGIIDTGVVLGLVWGIASLLWCIVRALTRPTFEHSAALPPALARKVTGTPDPA